MKVLIEKLKDNSGSGYLWFTVILVVTLILFTAIFNVINTSIAMKNIRTEVDAASEDVFANIKEVAYDHLTAGSTENTFSSLSDADVIEMLGDKLGVNVSYEYVSPTLKRIGGDGAWEYTISNLSYTYIDDAAPESATHVTYTVGDINHDTVIDNEDYELALEIWTSGVVPDGFYWLDLDINQNGVVEEKDIELLKSIVDYYELYDKDSHYTTSVALLVITFELEVPVKFASFDFGTSVETYSYVKPLTVKPA